MRGGVTISANHDHAGANQSLLFHDHVFNTLEGIVGTIKSRDPKALAVTFQCLSLNKGCFIVNSTGRLVMSRNNVVNDAKMRVGA